MANNPFRHIQFNQFGGQQMQGFAPGPYNMVQGGGQMQQPLQVHQPQQFQGQVNVPMTGGQALQQRRAMDAIKKEVMDSGRGYTAELNEIQQMMQTLMDEVEDHNTGLGASKIAGGGSTVLGGALLIAAPFTSGATLIPGIVATATGGITSIGGSISDYVKSGDFVERLGHASNSLMAAREKFGRSLLVAMQAKAVNSGVKASEIAKMTIGGLSSASGVGSAIFSAGSTVARTMVVDTGVGAVNIAPGAAAGARTTATIAGEGGAQSVAVGGMSTGAKVFGVAGGILGVAAGSFDIYTGINHLQDGHPTMEHIDNLISEIDTEKSNVATEMERIARM